MSRKAAAALLEETGRHEDVEESLAVVWPVVITEAPLFEAHLSPSGDLQTTPVERSTLRWRHPTAGRGLSTIDIVHTDAVATFVSELSAAVDLILWNTDQEMASTLQKRKEIAARRGSRTE